MKQIGEFLKGKFMKSLLYMYVGSSILLIVLAIPLLARKVKPNPLYGFRIRQTLEDPQVWYDVNAFFGRQLLMVGLLEGLATLLLYFLPGLNVDTYALACLGVFIVVFGVAMAKSLRYIKTLA